MSLNDIRAEDRIERHHAAALLTYASQIDPRVQLTDPNADVWYEALRGGTFGAAHEIIQAYYKRYDPKAPDAKPITPGYIRYTAIDRKTYQERREAAIDPPPPRKGRKMPRHVLEKFQANGYLLDRDLKEY